MGGRDGYEIEYDYYDSKGHRTGEVVLTQEMYDNEHWVLFSDEFGNIHYCSNNTGNFYFKHFYTSTVGNFQLFCDSSNAAEDTKTNYYTYDFSSKTWNISTCNKWSFTRTKGYIFNPRGIIKTKDMNVFYMYGSKIYDYHLYCSYISYPDISVYNDKIYIKLNDCFNYGTIDGVLEDGNVFTYLTYTVKSHSFVFFDQVSNEVIFQFSGGSIDSSTSYIEEIEDFYYFVINLADFDLHKSNKYEIHFTYDFSINTKFDDISYFAYVFDSRFIGNLNYSFTYDETSSGGIDNPNDPTQNIINSQQQTTEAIKEQTEVSKNIFEKIVDILSYINPFSENFFVYKLIELLIEMLKSLFIPSNEFFNTFFTDLNSWFSDRFGFLYYPLELFFDLCDRFVNIDFSEPIINIPDIIEPTTNLVLIHSTYYNFNSLLENDILKTVHDIYFIIVDAVIYIGLALLLYNKYEEVMTK